MSEYMSEQLLRDELLRMDTHCTICACLRLAEDERIPLLRNVIVCWLLAGCKYPDINNMIIDEKILD